MEMNKTKKPVEGLQYVSEQYPLSAETAKIIATAKKVHQTLGPGFPEVVYQRAMELELSIDGLNFQREVNFDINYRDHIIGKLRVDFIVENILVEMKAKSAIEDIDFAQTMSYLKVSGAKVALLLNFGSAKLGIKRLIN
ncbi:MAG: GxxExxY protein [Chloroflexi bacterium]|nr:MAG: GxxExxY protein [Chloroflexota bacterium]